MKTKIIPAIVFAVTLIGCNENKKKETVSPIVEETVVDEAYAVNNDWIRDIKLDNGSKWDANIETTKGVNAMLKHIGESDPQTVEEYHALAYKLNDEKNTIVKECTMKGPSHDNLHVFLHPLIEKIDHLLKVTSTEKGAEIIAGIDENLNAYKNYFQ